MRFSSRMYGGVQAFPDGRDALVVGSPFADPTQIALTALRPDGSTDPRFATDGRALIRTPWHGLDAALGTTVSIMQATPTEMVLVATNDNVDNQLQLIRVRL